MAISKLNENKTRVKVYMIVEMVNGVTDGPKLFTDEKKADQHYLRLVHDHYGVDFVDVDDAREHELDNQNPDIDIFYWVDELDLT